MRVAIIGTAGRGDTQRLLTLRHYNWMVDQVVQHTNKEDTFISGGAAWADHSAIGAFDIIQPQRIILHLPCPWDPDTQRFFDDGSRDFATNPGGTANYYHRLFQKTTNINSLKELHALWERSKTDKRIVICDKHKGFLARNLYVGEADKILAFTFGEGKHPADGGTKHTWNHSKARTKIHLSLQGI